MTKSNPLYITRVVVRRLFGMFDYVLEQTISGDQPGSIIILYGDNGSGKTTILRLIFHLLAPELDAGHKSEIAKTPFASFEITLSDKTVILAERPANNLIGSFTMTIKRFHKPPETFKLVATENLTIPGKGKLNEEDYKIYSEWSSLLQNLNIALYHLADDRTIEIAGTESLTTEEPEIKIEEHYRSKSEIRRPGQVATELLKKSIHRFTTWIMNQAIRASSLGESSVNTLYNEILRRLARPLTETPSIEFDKGLFETRIRKIEAQSRSLAIYGFLPEFSGKEIIHQIESTKARQNVDVMVQVVTPYLESLERRIEALKNLTVVLDNFLDIVNGFLSYKKVYFNIHKGLTITTNKDDPLNTDNLSSGERHLLLIFCNTVLALDHPSIFIIDEPEISLNIKWQRSLISSLCQLIGNKPIQYIFATHSLEIISQFRDRIIKLEQV